jgi:hypothetical protein
MTKRSDRLRDRLQISREAVNVIYTDKTKKIEKFLSEMMQKYMPAEINPSTHEIMVRLELINKYAIKISNSASTYTSIKQSGLSDCNITFDEISNHKREMMLKLKDHANSMIDLLENEHFPSLNGVISEIIGININPGNTIRKKNTHTILD